MTILLLPSLIVVSYCIPRQYLQCPKPLYVDLTFFFFPFLLKCWNRRRTRGPVVCQMQQERRKSNIDPSDTNHSTPPPPYPPFQSMGGRRVCNSSLASRPLQTPPGTQSVSEYKRQRISSDCCYRNSRCRSGNWHPRRHTYATFGQLFFILFFCFVFWGVLKKPKTFEEAIVYFFEEKKTPKLRMAEPFDSLCDEFPAQRRLISHPSIIGCLFWLKNIDSV